MVQGVQDALDEDREPQFERGEEMSSDILYEADGVTFSARRVSTTEERHPIKALEHVQDDTIPFWEGASLEWSKQ